MSLLSLAPESLRHIARYLAPQVDAPRPDINALFNDGESHRTSRMWVRGKEVKEHGQDDEVTLRDLRSFCNSNRWLRAALRELVLYTIRIVCEDTLTNLLADQDALELVHDLRLTPTQHLLPIAMQAEVLNRIKPGQLASLSLSLFPFLLANNLAAGFRPSDDVYLPVLSAVAALHVPELRLHTNIAGVAPSLRLIKDLRSIEILDEGLYDGGFPDDYEDILSEQYGTLVTLFAQSAHSLEKVTFRQRNHAVRPADYAFLDVCNILDAVTRNGLDGLANLRHLELHSITTNTQTLSHIFNSASKLASLTVFLRTPLSLPQLPHKLGSLNTNCHLPPNVDAIPPELHTLRVRHDGPLLPSPPDDYVPRLPLTLKCLHANMAPGVSSAMVRRLFQHCPNLENVELLALPLPWLDDCECPPANAQEAKKKTYEAGFSKHSQMNDPGRLGWRHDFDLPALISILQTLPHLDIFAMNHDHDISHAAFPDVHHLGIERSQSLAADWWKEHESHYIDLASQILDGVPQLRILRWRVCPSNYEAWMTFFRENGEIQGTLELETGTS